MNSMSKALSGDETTTDCQEESGWTMYLEDFSANNNEDNEKISYSSGIEGSSLISDAASSVTKKCADINEHVVGFSLEKSCHKLSVIKKKKSKGVLVDDALEDTASSPVASPKICSLMKLLGKDPKQKDSMGISQEKGSTSSKIDERSGLGFIGRDNDYTEELKKRALCLVPLSLVANFPG
ncbi:hypothetical protein CFOL_v3_04179 [Cephalotus follicularis]|uniref:Uncharacterized protein n=1 Tax=Cephalotus follicularis TaxID=3775 RepID=A0A1Q3AY59_CEPFO|nr:hypothetical protein CFOL_v3_04179 [Cephalotus follicularis]